MINVPKVIRVMGYIVYNILWSPIIIAYLLLGPILVLGMTVRNGGETKNVINDYVTTVRDHVKHDIAFLNTGNW